ncbi:nitroimidazol reductase NimA-like FMN-containing flavoprotein (pyridoxamine 5'-phosphate oxidase superfamily) [Paenibacillus sp. LBL]|uniref:pyridoxamine 5'-phosphate oxidase family protein n=1 Tax=Paenibacillus sp. LBL TaxID=2940563 RepID=UPI0024742F1D|nr:pyridoxamine 5'-phosphate oxidase family protein [Paenibacillus sp. LBL]MDH6673471.1 nitroimidazol reductase NimA-like FMN-containing flavoprotein (pyridoxamine 5'-phosphate oxidase superfamily) [Paenibacillus sp. LBL]
MRRDEFAMEDPHEVEDFLNGMSFGFLGTTDEAGIPRVTPLNFAYVNGAFYFHGSRMGEKMEHLRRTPAVCFTVADEYALIPSYFSDPEMACPATAFFKSVTAVGEVILVDDLEEKALAMEALMQKLQPEGGYRTIDASDRAYIPRLKGVAVIKLAPQRMSAKFKFGQNLKPERLNSVVEELECRGKHRDEETAELMCKYHPVPR